MNNSTIDYSGPTTAEGREWISVGEAAELAGVSEWTVRRLLRAGLSGSRKVGRRWQLEASSWRHYIAEHTR